MITNISTFIHKGRIYAYIRRDEIDEGETITIKPSEFSDDTFTKYLPNEGEIIEVDITPYCKSEIRGGIAEYWDGFSYGESCDCRGISAAVLPSINGEQQNSIYYTNIKDTSTRLLTKLPYLQVSEIDGIYPLFLALHLADDANLHIYCEEFDFNIFGVGYETLCFHSLGFENTPTGDIVIYDTVNGNRQRYPFKVVPSGMNTRRLVWRNEVGGIDSWSFEFLRESSLSTASDVFYSAKGYTRTNRVAERAHIVETRELDDITASVVAYIIASPEVYLMQDGNELIPIDIVTEECRTYSDTELSSIQVAYRLKEREL